MAETLRIVTFAYGGRPVGRKDLLVGGSYEKVAESTEITPGQKNQVMAKRSRRYAGARQAAESHEPGQYKATWLISGASQDTCIANLEGLVAELEQAARPGRFLEWKPDGASYPTYYEIVAVPSYNPRYKWYELVNDPAILQAELLFPIAPLGYLPQMDIYDGFDVDSLSDYTFDSGSAAICTVANGAVNPNGSLTTERRAVHTARGYTHLGGQGTTRFVPGPTITSFKATAELRRSAANTYLEVYVDDDGANSRLRIDKVIAGARTNLQTNNLAARLANGIPGAVRGRIEGNLVYAEYFTGESTPMGAPTLAPAAYQLTAGEQAALPAGSPAWGWIPQHASAQLLSFEFEPYVWRNRTLPDVIPLDHPVPGSAPALFDLEVTPSGGSAAPVAALVGWSQRPTLANLVWNGDFEDDTNGWSVAAVTGVTGAASSITRVTTAAKVKYGTAAGEIVTPATANTGASFAIYGRFRKGVTYTAELWVNSAAQTTLTRLRLGMNGDIASETATALSATLTRRTVTWTPTADREVAYVAFEVTAATATTMAIDGVMVYEGVTAPTISTQTEGRGGLPPFGIIPAESCDTGDLSGWAISADANYRHGQGLKVTAAGAGTAAAQWFIDPALLLADEFTLQELDVEVFAKVDLASTLVSPKLTLSCRPEAGTNFGAERFTGEWQSAGRLLTKPSSGSAFRTVRLGIITLVCDPERPVRWKLRGAASWAVGSTGNYGLDELYIAPVRKRAASPTGKANDATYPKFVASTAETTKTIRSDLSGLAAKPPANPFPDSGLDGMTGLELPPGLVDVLVKLCSTVPDDPTSDTSSEQKEHAGTVHLAVWPRVNLLRGA